MPFSLGLIQTPPGALSQGVCVAYVRRSLVDEIDKVGQAGCHLNTQALTEFSILVEPGGDIGYGILGSSGAGKGNLV